jgi:hypothetical protein
MDASLGQKKGGNKESKVKCQMIGSNKIYVKKSRKGEAMILLLPERNGMGTLQVRK